MLDSRIIHFIKKEFIQLLRDPRMVYLAVLAPIIQLLAFGYVASTDIKHVQSAVFDQDHSSYSRSYVQSFKNSGYFDFDYQAESQKEIVRLVDSGRVKMALHIPAGFGKNIVRGKTASVLAVLDGENSSSATIISGYLKQINFENVNKIYAQKIFGLGGINFLRLQTRVWYSPEMKSVNYMVPGVFAMVLMVQIMILTAFSVVKEKERGTMEMLIVTPLKASELILGKLLPFAIVGFIDMTFIFLVSTLWFRVPINGSPLLLFALGAIFLSTGLGLGLFISTISQTQRQAMMSALFILIPSLIISGFIFPIANMPAIIQAITYLIPLRYFLVIVRGIFLKGIGMRYLYNEVWPLIIFGSIILSLSILRFRKKLE